MLARIFLGHKVGHKGREMVSLPRRLVLAELGSIVLVAATGKASAAPKAAPAPAPIDNSPAAAMERFQRTSKATVYNITNGGAYIVLEPKAESSRPGRGVDAIHHDVQKWQAIKEWEKDAKRAGIYVSYVSDDHKALEKRAILFVPNDGTKPETAYVQYFSPSGASRPMRVHDNAAAPSANSMTIVPGSLGNMHVTCKDSGTLTFTERTGPTQEAQKLLDAGSLKISTNFPKNLAVLSQAYEGNDGNYYVESMVRRSANLGDVERIIHKIRDYKEIKAAVVDHANNPNSSLGQFSGPYKNLPESVQTKDPERFKLGDVVLRKITPQDGFWRTLKANGLHHENGASLIVSHWSIKPGPETELVTACIRPENAMAKAAGIEAQPK